MVPKNFWFTHGLNLNLTPWFFEMSLYLLFKIVHSNADPFYSVAYQTINIIIYNCFVSYRQ